jgi:hypothetical protein
VRRPAGAALILVGCFVLAVEIPDLDRIVASFSWDRGVHVSDLVGFALVIAGVALLWRP